MDAGQNRADTKQDLIAKAKGLARLFRERAAAGEELRRMPDESIADIVAAGIPRICQPEKYGGRLGGGADNWSARPMEKSSGTMRRTSHFHR